MAVDQIVDTRPEFQKNFAQTAVMTMRACQETHQLDRVMIVWLPWWFKAATTTVWVPAVTTVFPAA